MILIFVAAKKNGFACSGRGDYDLPRPILIFVVAKKNGFACSGRGGYDLPRPILIFVAAKKNGFACRTDLLLLRFLISAPNLGIAARKPSRMVPRLQ